ncbi:MAG: DUF3592 domain-containing protein [Candidatus Pelethousia sp.]|nr:DUF3592 domain-containing protein [Candidatus Pelethousia sp.]
MKIFAKIIFIFVGISAILLPVVAIRRMRRLKREGVRASATVIDNIRGTGRGTRYYPVLEYLVDGKLVRAEGGDTPGGKYPVGTVLEICYDPRKPEQVLVGEPKLAGYIFLMIIGVACIAVGVLA